MPAKPLQKPVNPCFSCGPCAKRPGWDFTNLDRDTLGRSHRSNVSKKKLKEILDRSRALLDIPADYLIGITPASDTGAVEMALWNLLGVDDIGVDVFAWERFSRLWLEDIMDELSLTDRRAFEAPYGELPDFSQMQPNRDAIFAWNGTTSGARIPHADMIPAGDKGLRICDATSAMFAYEMPWEKLDVTTWSWQKVMGGEAQHGMIVFSPKAIKRLETHKPKWPIPKVLKLYNEVGEVDWPFFEGVTINTPSMLCVADALDSLRWMESIGGRAAIQKRVDDNAKAVDDWVTATPWIDYLTTDKTLRSKTSICLQIVSAEYERLTPVQKNQIVDQMAALLDQEGVGYDIRGYKTAPVGFRFWCGGTVEANDLRLLTQWMDWAYVEIMSSLN